MFGALLELKTTEKRSASFEPRKRLSDFGDDGRFMKSREPNVHVVSCVGNPGGGFESGFPVGRDLFAAGLPKRAKRFRFSCCVELPRKLVLVAIICTRATMQGNKLGREQFQDIRES